MPKLAASGIHTGRRALEIFLPDHPGARNLKTMTGMVGIQKPPWWWQGTAWEFFTDGTPLWQGPREPLSHLERTCGEFWEPPLALPMSFILTAIFSFVGHGQGWATQAESPGDDSMFLSILFRRIKPSSPVSASIGPPGGTINCGDLTAAVTLSNPLENNRSCLHDCPEEALSHQERLKNGSLKNGIRNCWVHIRKGRLVQ